MGSCFSVQKSSEAPVGRNQSVVSEAEEMVRVPEKKRRAENGGIGSVDERARQSSDLSLVRRSYAGSRDEAFFDSLAWLESDCDDDYASVRGDFTPHSGNTFQGSPIVATRPTLASIVSSMSDPKAITVVGLSQFDRQNSPTDSKKRLEELFKETADDDIAPLQSTTDHQKDNGENLGVNEPNAALPLKVLIASTPTHADRASVGNGETPNIMTSEVSCRKECKCSKCCVPGLLQSFNSTERKKLSLSSPVGTVEAAA